MSESQTRFIIFLFIGIVFFFALFWALVPAGEISGICPPDILDPWDPWGILGDFRKKDPSDPL